MDAGEAEAAPSDERIPEEKSFDPDLPAPQLVYGKLLYFLECACHV